MPIQSVIFPVSSYTVAQARKWLAAHHLVSTKVHTTAHFHRFRQYPPKRERYRAQRLPSGIELIVGFK